MEVFISWSGEASHIVGLALKDWLPSVIQSIEPFISSEDIAKGTRWFSEIGNQLGKTSFGVICLTPENCKEPWILFESGAISKSIGESSIAPILLGMSISELEGPLAQFNATQANKADILKLMKSINDKIDSTKERKLEPQKLEKIFEALWPELEEKINDCQQVIEMSKLANPATEIKRPMNDMLEELIELNRSNARSLGELSSNINKGFDVVFKQTYSDEKRRKINLECDADLRNIEDKYERTQSEFYEIQSAVEHIHAELKHIGPLTEINSADTERHSRISMLEAKLNEMMSILRSKEVERSHMRALIKDKYASRR
jgi:hypothetical protein